MRFFADLASLDMAFSPIPEEGDARLSVPSPIVPLIQVNGRPDTTALTTTSAIRHAAWRRGRIKRQLEDQTELPPDRQIQCRLIAAIGRGPRSWLQSK